MTRQTVILALLFALAVLPGASCQQQPVPPAVGGATSTGGAGLGGSPGVAGETALGGTAGATVRPCHLVCANLARLGCPEDQATCFGQCEILASDSRFTLGIQCRINAKTKAEAQACGPASCRE